MKMKAYSYRNRVIQSEWIANFDFRATGPEYGGGNLQIWYTREGEAGIGSSSVYTVGKFEGLAIVIDMYGNRVSQRLPTLPSWLVH